MTVRDRDKTLQLESAACPVPVKKQRKYNLARWAVTGRDNIGINAACQRIYTCCASGPSASDGDWKELCHLWASDFRTHITEKRWKRYCARPGSHGSAPGHSASAVPLSPATWAKRQASAISISRRRTIARRLDRRRGLAIQRRRIRA